MDPVEALLSQIEAQVEIARTAKTEEAEAAFRRAVMLIAADADALAEVVTAW